MFVVVTAVTSAIEARQLHAKASSKWLRERPALGEPRGQPPLGQGLTVPRNNATICPVQWVLRCAMLYDEEGEACGIPSQSSPSKPLGARPRVDTPSCFGFLVSTCSLRETFSQCSVCGCPPQSTLQAQPQAHWQCLICSSCLASPQRAAAGLAGSPRHYVTCSGTKFPSEHHKLKGAFISQRDKKPL